jgi:hypothetical protein
MLAQSSIIFGKGGHPSKLAQSSRTHIQTRSIVAQLYSPIRRVYRHMSHHSAQRRQFLEQQIWKTISPTIQVTEFFPA